MKKGYLIIGGVVVAAAIVVSVVAMGGSKKDSKSTKTSSASSSSGFKANVKDACDILTQSVADSLLGAGSTKGDTTAGNTENSTVKVSNCNYTSSDNKTSLGLLVRAAKDKTQADSDVTQFQGTTNVPGYGDGAYWASSYGQFNILAHNNWYILSYGPLNPTLRTQADAQKAADLIKSQL